ncbi:SDR family NAD(P)-dependent oxidoreductase [Nonomuraea sp. FMUSA5-5]|uniref:SDR family NAD(P)-dependent oxidoreductase n=1 Tax=Nonomuraea composti TaxID=2720023 RepID=A0ABX1BQX6_9ACTN|nr:type I polyketide synthase [Nonomuraea sp. FMUSA5-5]NJP98652.1 SDR family NAD(P)-dependent oxidoreductase [Nonomuraea sp. FMUSA5-5]
MVTLAVRASGLNYRDVLIATNLLPGEAIEGTLSAAGTGLECAGIVTAVGDGVEHLAVGDRVCAMAPAALASHTTTAAAVTGKIPDEMSFAEAATLPVLAATVHYALAHRARLRPGESVLVHGGAGGVGLATLRYARHVGAQVIATAGTEAKRDLLRALGVEHVFNSRDLTFVEHVERLGGVDVVVNSLSGEAMVRSLELLRPGGRFIELGKRDILGGGSLPMNPFHGDITFCGVDVTRMPQHLFAEVFAAIRQGVHRPLPYTLYPAARVAEAFSAMRHSRHIGKIVVSFDEQDEPLAIEARATAPVLDAEGTYLVSGGLSGFGAATARRLAERGARHLALVSRRGPAAPEASALLAELAERGVRAQAYAADVADPAAMAKVIQAIHVGGHAPAGIVHAAMHLDDDALTELSDERINAVLLPKIAGGLVLDEIARSHDIAQFIMYSTVSAVMGNARQSPYAAANLFLEALVRQRRARQESGIALAWGHIGDVGYIARNDISHFVTGIGLLPIPSAEALAAGEHLAATGASVCAVSRSHWGRVRGVLATADAATRFSLLIPADHEGDGQPGGHDKLRELATMPLEQVVPHVAGTLIQALAKVLHTDPGLLDRSKPLQDYGLDSLMAAELSVRARNLYSVEISPTELLRASTTVDDLAQFVCARLPSRQDLKESRPS